MEWFWELYAHQTESPSLRGSGLKSEYTLVMMTYITLSPSLRGSGLKYFAHVSSSRIVTVSLFTREWIEISTSSVSAGGSPCLPLYEGVD